MASQENVTCGGRSGSMSKILRSILKMRDEKNGTYTKQGTYW